MKLCSVCRYSRRVIWLEVGTSNSDPSVIAYHYLEAVKQRGGIQAHIRDIMYVQLLISTLTVQLCFTSMYTIGYPRLLRCDLGTENSNYSHFCEEMERTLWLDSPVSYMAGQFQTIANIKQRIEAWWGILRR
jgi:hypothetical protein